MNENKTSYIENLPVDTHESLPTSAAVEEIGNSAVRLSFATESTPSDGQGEGLITGRVVEAMDAREVLMSAIVQFAENFQGLSVERKQTSVAELYDVIDGYYNAKYRGKSVPAVFSTSGNYAFNHDGFVRIPLGDLEKRSSTETIFSILHEYRHVMQQSLGMQSDGWGFFSVLSHDMAPHEIDATKFTFDVMDEAGVDKTKIERYEDWQKAIRIVDGVDRLKQEYGEEIADDVKDIYELLDEYTLQTTRTDLDKGRLHRIRTKIDFRPHLTSARAKLLKLNKTAKASNDVYLSGIVSDIRADWPQYF